MNIINRGRINSVHASHTILTQWEIDV